MQIHRERKQVITIELGLAEARELAQEIEICYVKGPGAVLEQFRERLEYHVAEAEKGNPSV